MNLKRICLYMILPPLLVSCGRGGYKGVDESCLPQTFEIDYVRVFQKAR